MIRLKIFLLIFLSVIISSQAAWEEPYFKVTNDEIASEGVISPLSVILNLNENVVPDIKIGEFVKIVQKPVIGGTDHRFSIVENADIFELHTRYVYDYEKDGPDSVAISSEGTLVVFTINIVNLNDNSMSISNLPDCIVEENLAEGTVTACEYTIEDADGMMGDFIIDITNDNFQMQWKDGPPATEVTSAVAVLITKAPLDFEKSQIENFDWTIEDSPYSAYTRIIVKVQDMNDEPPMWKQISSLITLDENKLDSITVLAIDGDIGINDPITYTCEAQSLTGVDCTEVTAGGELIIKLGEFDRDPESNSISFTVIATEDNTEALKISQTISVMINDENDNAPQIKPENLNYPPIPEGKYQKLEGEIEINDIDMVDNARYTVELEVTDKNGDKVDENIFQIVPDTGYRDQKFSLTILNAELLDYENENMQELSIRVIPKEFSVSGQAVKELTAKITLENWNDEIPEFIKEEYIVDIPEIFGRDGVEEKLVEDLEAIDRDIGDTLTYELLGSSINKLLEFKKDGDGNVITPLVLVSKSLGNVQLFDFEKGAEVLVQIQVQDELNFPTDARHKVVTQLTLRLGDVNDETPIISQNQQSLTILEGQEHETKLEVSISATDGDASAEVEFDIDWVSSYATKNGQKLTDEGWKGCITIDTIKNGNEFEAELKIFIDSSSPKQIPDYEVYDTMYLTIIAEDTKQEYGIGTTQVVFIINVQNDNDEAPVFVKNSIADRTIPESITAPQLVGVITATDIDGDDVTFEDLKPLDDTPDGWIIINEDGELRVAGEIECDNPNPIDSLKYTVTATDGKHPIEANIIIMIEDANDNKPKIDTIEDKSVEEEKVDPNFLQVVAKDVDRDDPNNVMIYYLEGDDADTYFKINEESGMISITNKVDRDKGPKEFTLTVRVKDKGPGDDSQDTKTFKVIILDINDNKPTLTSLEVNTSEDKIEGENVGFVNAIDDDEERTDNSRILITISRITQNNLPTTDLAPGDFDVVMESEFSPAKGNLILKRDLKGVYGWYEIHFELTDFGTEPQNDVGKVTLYIEPYNFDIPEFKYPTDGSKIYLSPGQELGKPVYLFDNTAMDAIQADVDNPGKFPLRFIVTEFNNGDDYFLINQFNLLCLKERVDEEATHEIEIKAIIDGTPPSETTIKLEIAFVDDSAYPEYKEEERTIDIYVTETEEGVGEEFETGTAHIIVGGVPEDLYPIYYVFFNNPGNFFEIDKNTGIITVSKALNIIDPEVPEHITILASTSESGESQPNPEQLLQVNINLIDVNTFDPEFEKEIYYGGVMIGYELGRVILTVLANDKDPNDIIEYSMVPGSFQANGNGITTNNKITVETNGQVKLRFEVQSNMDGYFSFKARADDTLHQAEVEVIIYVISDVHVYIFRFENTLDDVNAKKNVIEEIFSTQLNYICTVDSIYQVVDDNNQPMPYKTEVKSHFISPDTQMPLEASHIASLMSNVNTYGEIKRAFSKEGLLLELIPQDEESAESKAEARAEQLKAWLIGVTILLGSLVILFAIAFVLRNRSLKRRLNKLSTVKFNSSESVNNIPAAPNTNRRAVEGSNPIYNIEEKVGEKVHEFDNNSINSTDSDLIGVENNPAFNMNGSNGSISE